MLPSLNQLRLCSTKQCNTITSDTPHGTQLTVILSWNSVPWNCVATEISSVASAQKRLCFQNPYQTGRRPADFGFALYETAQKKRYRGGQSVNRSIGMCVVCPPRRAHVTVTYIPIDPALRLCDWGPTSGGHLGSATGCPREFAGDWPRVAQPRPHQSPDN